MKVAELVHPASGRKMTISSTQQAVVVYTGNYLPEEGSDGKHRQHATVCLETVILNDAVNRIGVEDWPKAYRVLFSPENPYAHVTLHEFSHTE